MISCNLLLQLLSCACDCGVRVASRVLCALDSRRDSCKCCRCEPSYASQNGSEYSNTAASGSWTPAETVDHTSRVAIEQSCTLDSRRDSCECYRCKLSSASPRPSNFTRILLHLTLRLVRTVESVHLELQSGTRVPSIVVETFADSTDANPRTLHKKAQVTQILLHRITRLVLPAIHNGPRVVISACHILRFLRESCKSEHCERFTSLPKLDFRLLSKMELVSSAFHYGPRFAIRVLSALEYR